MVRTIESLLEEAQFAKEPARSELKQCAAILSVFSESYVLNEIFLLENRLKIYKKSEENTEFNGTQESVKKEVTNIKKRLRILKIIIN